MVRDELARLHGGAKLLLATEEHRLLLDACAARDVDRAAWLLSQHLSETACALLRTVDPDYLAETLRSAVAPLTGPGDNQVRLYHALGCAGGTM